MNENIEKISNISILEVVKDTTVVVIEGVVPTTSLIDDASNEETLVANVEYEFVAEISFDGTINTINKGLVSDSLEKVTERDVKNEKNSFLGR